MSMKQAATLLEVQAVTEPTPLKDDALARFYVTTDPARDPDFPVSSQLQEYIYSSSTPLKLLFASHPGSGKTTELNNLVKDAQDDFFVIYFSVRDELDIATLTAVDLILALMEKLYEQGRNERLIRDKRVIEPVRNWLSEIVIENNIQKKGELEGAIGIGTEGLLRQVIGILAGIKETFLYAHESAETMRRVIKPRLAELRNHCNLVIAEITQNLETRVPHKRLLIIVDDTDKLDVSVAQELFIKQTAILSNIQTSIIYTVPLYLILSPERQRLKSYFDTLTLPMIKTYTMEGSYFASGRNILMEIVSRRISDHLIDTDALELAIEKTGGILRDLLQIIRSGGQYARYAGEQKITYKAIRSSLDRMKSAYSTSVYGRNGISTEALYDKLKEVENAPHGRVPFDDRLRLLLYVQAVIQYNGRVWYDLHPLMWEILDEMGMLKNVA